ncbi:unnamed protein product [Parascedosporium putredinis]|uniref:Uncharacterized protein n=1 Tax=Parascedosporium putredinis TaxID=1442378 RepID=A0A9P1HAX2_9PEZI|nr:unnamed protein product [Parascedosporium putredinis]CAI8002173.1 unnamed protein product [Parascedosporium putredinis]
MAGARFPRFFDLPREIRDQVLWFLVTTDQSLHLASSASQPPLNLLLAHPFLHESVCRLFFTTNKFTSSGVPELLDVPAKTLRRIRQLRVAAVLRQRPLETLVASLSDAVLNGGLRVLELHIPPPNAFEHDPQLPEGMCRSLVHLLKDPYLESARLWIDFNHRAAWCRFHPGARCPHTLRDDRELPGLRGGVVPGPIEVDLGLLAERYGDNERLKMMVV